MRKSKSRITFARLTWDEIYSISKIYNDEPPIRKLVTHIKFIEYLLNKHEKRQSKKEAKETKEP